MSKAKAKRPPERRRTEDPPETGPHRLEALFNPGAIAVVGASESGSVGARVFANLVSGGFDGPVVPVNPKYAELADRRCYDSLTEIDEDIDLAVIATPARTVPGVHLRGPSRRALAVR